MASNNSSGISEVAAMRMASHQQSPQYVSGTVGDSKGMNKVGTVLVESVRSYLSRKTVGRNGPCPCKSGKKWKNCHGKMKLVARPTMVGKMVRCTSTSDALREIENE